MVRFDNGALAEAGFDYVRIDGALYEEVYGAYFLCFFFEYSDEFLTDYLTLCLRISYACEL